MIAGSRALSLILITREVAIRTVSRPKNLAPGPAAGLSRRDFLASALGAVLVAGCAAPRTNPSLRERWQIGHHFWNWDHAWNHAEFLDERLRLTALTGYDGFEAKPAEIGVGPEALRVACTHFGVRCAAIGGGIEEAVEYASRAGVGIVRAKVSRKDAPRWVDYAGERGIIIVVHPHVAEGEGAVETREQLLRYLDGRPGIFACPDTGHLMLCGSDPVRTIRDLGERCRYIHLKDVLPEMVGRCVTNGEKFCELGTGALDIPGVLDALESIRYDGWIMVERDSREPDYVRSARRMRRVLQKLI